MTSRVARRSRDGRIRQNLCPRCKENFKNTESKLCAECNLGRRRATIPGPPTDYGSYFPKGGRYGLLCVWGYGGDKGGSDAYACSMSILDGHHMWEEIRRVTVNENRFPGVRTLLMREIRAMNKREDSASGPVPNVPVVVGHSRAQNQIGQR